MGATLHGGATAAGGGAGAGAVTTTVVVGAGAGATTVVVVGVLAAATTAPPTIAPATKPAAASPLSQFEQLLQLPPEELFCTLVTVVDRVFCMSVAVDCRAAWFWLDASWR
jgi:hypothetical protein